MTATLTLPFKPIHMSVCIGFLSHIQPEANSTLQGVPNKHCLLTLLILTCLDMRLMVNLHTVGHVGKFCASYGVSL